MIGTFEDMHTYVDRVTMLSIQSFKKTVGSFRRNENRDGIWLVILTGSIDQPMAVDHLPIKS